jgi:hypothetical protein
VQEQTAAHAAIGPVRRSRRRCLLGNPQPQPKLAFDHAGGSWSTLHQATRQPNPPPLPAHPGSQNPRGNPEDHVAEQGVRARPDRREHPAPTIQCRRCGARRSQRHACSLLVHQPIRPPADQEPHAHERMKELRYRHRRSARGSGSLGRPSPICWVPCPGVLS